MTTDKRRDRPLVARAARPGRARSGLDEAQSKLRVRAWGGGSSPTSGDGRATEAQFEG